MMDVKREKGRDALIKRQRLVPKRRIEAITYDSLAIKKQKARGKD